jgi:hypothetical protein
MRRRITLATLNLPWIRHPAATRKHKFEYGESAQSLQTNTRTGTHIDNFNSENSLCRSPRGACVNLLCPPHEMHLPLPKKGNVKSTAILAPLHTCRLTETRQPCSVSPLKSFTATRFPDVSNTREAYKNGASGVVDGRHEMGRAEESTYLHDGKETTTLQCRSKRWSIGQCLHPPSFPSIQLRVLII